MNIDINTVTVSGKVVKDLELIPAKNESHWGDLILEVRGVKGSQKIKVKLFGETADRNHDLKAGDEVVVQGRISGNEWQDKVYTDFVANQINLTNRQRPEPEDLEKESVDWDKNYEF